MRPATIIPTKKPVSSRTTRKTARNTPPALRPADRVAFRGKPVPDGPVRLAQPRSFPQQDTKQDGLPKPPRRVSDTGAPHDDRIRRRTPAGSPENTPPKGDLFSTLRRAESAGSLAGELPGTDHIFRRQHAVELLLAHQSPFEHQIVDAFPGMERRFGQFGRRLVP